MAAAAAAWPADFTEESNIAAATAAAYVVVVCQYISNVAKDSLLWRSKYSIYTV